ncbi:hypothetical protein HYC85_023725 [Camellia sinensis]|uniref:F-ATPase protein 6 n=1 Tax=Camellia sinensis TaxID=4442 RepID=A0A7J7GJ81_CAMSI|nr:hypothetical protein HYC85_023725 [Camellia sinensis]
MEVQLPPVPEVSEPLPLAEEPVPPLFEIQASEVASLYLTRPKQCPKTPMPFLVGPTGDFRQGMIPYSFTVTSHFLITLGLSFSLFIGITIVGFQRNGLHFLSFSLPAGVPLPLAPFLVLLELIPHCFRALSPGIRLFANMMAGHSSVKILSGSAWTMLCMNDLLYFIGDLGPLFIVLALTGPELGVAISQAHVSTISICIYLNDATNLHQSARSKAALPSLRSEGARTSPGSKKKKIPSTSGQSLSCLYHESFSLANNKEFKFCTYPRVLQFAFSLIEEISKGLGADEAFLLSSRSALAPDLELAVLDLRLVESLPFRYFRPLPKGG